MQIRIISILLIILAIQLNGVQAQSKKDNIDELFTERGEIYFKFENHGIKDLTLLSGTISIDRLSGHNVFFAYANKKEFQNFLDFGLEYEILTPPGLAHKVTMKSQVNGKEINDWDFYPDYDAYISMMNQFAIDYPNLCEVVSIGQSIEGRELLFVKISDNIAQNEGEPQFLYTATMHGDETAGYVLSLRLIDYLLSNYGTDPKIDNLVNNLEIWINPLANPDGTFAGGNNTVYGATRYNANWVDLNRNYPDPEDGPHPDGNPWQVETIAFMNFAEANHFVLASNFHGGAEVCNYPWDTWAPLAADDNWWQYVCHEYADTAHLFSPAGYMTGFDNGITNGYQWYTISGGRQDYMNYFHQCREFTLEMSNEKLLPASQLPDHWEYNYRSMLNFMEQSLFGICGTVTDAISGNPVYAEVFIENHDLDSSWVYTNSDGKYFRPVFEGTYDLTFSAFGYYSTTIEDVSAVNRQLTTQNVQLTPGDLIVDFSASATSIPIGSTIDFTDQTFGNPISWSWTFEGAVPSTSTEQYPANILYPDEGVYDVSLTVSDGTNSQTITKEGYISVSVEFVMQNITITTCSGIFYDSGGASGNYGNNEDFEMTFMPAVPEGKIICEFTSFNIEFDPSCDYDWLKIYDGPNSSSALLGTYCGTNSPGAITATNSEGALTFTFHSDNSVTELGWTANISCETTLLPPVADFVADNTLIKEGESILFSDLSLNNPASWEWVFEGGTPSTSSEQNPVVVYEDPGIYDVSLTATNTSGSNTLLISDYIIVESLTKIYETIGKQTRLFPNPVSNSLNISSDFEIEKITVYNSLGELIKYYAPSKKSLILNIDELQEGFYIVGINSGSKVEFHKIQVVR